MGGGGGREKYNEEAYESDELALAREARAMKRNSIALDCGCVMTITMINQFSWLGLVTWSLHQAQCSGYLWGDGRPGGF